jgi:quercetin dioxygenase-like cupin family protein
VSRPIRAALAVGLLAIAPPAARGHALAQTEEARVADILQAALVKHGGDVNRCFEKALADTLDVAGKIELAVDVGDNGRVTKAKPESDGVKSPVLLACLVDSAATWTLAGIDPGSTVVVPLSFEGQTAQFSIKAKDAPDRGPPGAAGKGGKKGAPAGAPPFSVKLLVDESTMRAQKAALTQLTIAPANRIAMHKHPGAEVLYVVEGHARILGPTGMGPEKIDKGDAILIPAGMPHAIENMGRTSSAVMLQVFAPMGPERVYRDPKDEAGRAAFEVIRDPSKAAPPAGAKLTVGAPGETLAVFGGKGKIKPLLEPSKTGSRALYVGLLEAEPGTEVPRHSHAGSAEILFVLSGAGDMTVGSEKVPFAADEALHIPDGQPHAAKFTGPDKTVMLQIFAPAGPEERYRAPAAGGGKPKAK